MGWLHVLIPIGAAWLFGPEHPKLFTAAIATTAVSISTWSVMYRVARRSARERKERLIENMRLEGRPPSDIERAQSLRVTLRPDDAAMAPNWATLLSVASAGVGIVLLVWAVIVRFV